MPTKHRVVLIKPRLWNRSAQDRFPFNPFYTGVNLCAYHGFAIDDRGKFGSDLEHQPHKWIRGSVPRAPIVLPLRSHPIDIAVARASLVRYFEPMEPKVTPFQWDGYVDLPFGLGDFGPRGRAQTVDEDAVVLPRVRIGAPDPDDEQFVRLDFPQVGWHVSMPKCHRLKVLDWKPLESSHHPKFKEEIELAIPPSELPPASWHYSSLLLRESVYFELRDAFPPTYFDIKPQAE